MPRSDGFKEFVLDQLADLRGVTCRAMFGGYGLYRGESFFGIIHQGRLYFKTDERTRPAYAAQGMKPFRPNTKQTVKNYGSSGFCVGTALQHVPRLRFEGERVGVRGTIGGPEIRGTLCS